MLTQQLVNGLMLGSMYSLIAIGYTLVFGLLHLLNLAHGEIFMIAGFIGLFLAAIFDLPVWLTVMGSMLGAGLLGLLLEVVCFRKVKKDFPLAPVVSTLAFGLILVTLATNLVGSEPQVFPANIAMKDFQVGPLLISSVQVIILGVSIILMGGLAYVIQKTKLGRSMRAMAENPAAAKLLGVDVAKLTMMTFFISAVLAGAAGILIGIRIGKISPFIGSIMGLKGLAVMVIGGLGNIYGAMVGGLIIGVAEVMVITFGSAAYSDAVVWGILVLIVIFKPNGLFGSKVQTERV
ncbi:MAG: branched-chain amino acid ABC transporter permease [Thermincolia bacterium]